MLKSEWDSLSLRVSWVDGLTRMVIEVLMGSKTHGLSVERIALALSAAPFHSSPITPLTPFPPTQRSIPSYTPRA